MFSGVRVTWFSLVKGTCLAIKGEVDAAVTGVYQFGMLIANALFVGTKSNESTNKLLKNSVNKALLPAAPAKPEMSKVPPGAESKPAEVVGALELAKLS